MSRFEYSDACAAATGATAAENRSSPRKNPPKSVFDEARFEATGPRSVTSGRNAAIALLMSAPRLASASLNPTVASVTPLRVGGLNIDSSWSRSTSAVLCPSGTVAPLRHTCRELPLSTSMNFSPIDPFSRTSNTELTGRGCTFLSSDRFNTAIGCPAGPRPGSTEVTSPISAPPMWTSPPCVNSWASGIWTWSAYLGTNGSPLSA